MANWQIKETSKLINALLPCFWVHFVIFLTPTLGLSIRRQVGLFPGLIYVKIPQKCEFFD